jgi:hypothetical protein
MDYDKYATAGPGGAGSGIDIFRRPSPNHHKFKLALLGLLWRA